MQIAKLIFKTLHNNLSPPCFKNMFVTTSMIHSHGTRAEQRQDLFLKQAKSNIRKFATSVRGPEIWNSIPINIRQSHCMSFFISQLKSYLLSNM